MFGIFQENALFFPKVFFLNQVLVFPTSLCGVLVFDSVSHRLRRLRVMNHLFHIPTLSHAFTHHLSHTIFVTHHLSHTSLSHTISHTPSLSHTIFVTTLSHTIFVAHHLSHTIFVTHHLSHTILGDMCLRFAWQAWHFVTSTFVLRGRRGTYGTGLDLVSRLGALGRAWAPVTPPNFAWQAWHLATSTLHGLAWQALHLVTSTWHLVTASTGLALVARLGALGRRCRRPTLRGRRSSWRHPPWFRVACMALGDIRLRFCLAGKALGVIRLRFAQQARHLVTSIFVLRGRRGASWHPPSFYVADRALMALGLGTLGRRWRRPTLPARRGTWRHPPSFRMASVAGVELGDIHLRFAWQAWHLATSIPWFCEAGVALVALGWFWCCAWACLGAGDAAQLCVVGVALGDIHLLRGMDGRRGTLWHQPFAWQPRHLWHALVARMGALGRRCRRPTLRGRHGTWRHPPWFRVAGMALGDIRLRFCLAGKALGVIRLRFA